MKDLCIKSITHNLHKNEFLNFQPSSVHFASAVVAVVCSQFVCCIVPCGMIAGCIQTLLTDTTSYGNGSWGWPDADR